ncbi:MAG: hypothetical protein ACO219_01955 [Holophagaceae bacterium]
MQPQQIQKKILYSLASYERILQASSEEAFTCPPESGGWSRSQVFSHVLGVHGWILARIEAWPTKTHEQTKSQSLIVYLIFFFGTLGPKKIKAPKVVQDEVRILSKEEASELLDKFKMQLNKVTPLLDLIPSNRGWDHPMMGFLTINQWYQLIEIHSRHHEKQL